MLVSQLHHLLQHNVLEQEVLAGYDDLPDSLVNHEHGTDAGERQEGQDELQHLAGQHVKHDHNCNIGNIYIFRFSEIFCLRHSSYQLMITTTLHCIGGESKCN